MCIFSSFIIIDGLHFYLLIEEAIKTTDGGTEENEMPKYGFAHIFFD